ncbi:GntR family transcriptional regulator [Stappia sp. 22II-S9-Z10]|nr:GntR family transcriptional regulator [Stappia sp. 22II-S9-Z10]
MQPARPFDPIVPDDLVLKVRERLVEAIIFGEIAGGERLVEETLAERFGISRSPVRRALHELAAQGLLVRSDSRRLMVAPLDRRTLDELVVCCVPLEGIAAAGAAENRADAEHKAALERRVDALEQARSGGNIRDFFHATVAFRQSIHAMSGNRALIRILGALGLQSQRYRYAAYLMFPSVIDLSMTASEAIAAAVIAGDAAAASSVTENVITQCWQHARGGFCD